MAELFGRDVKEQAFAKKLGALFAKHRRELERVAGYPPDPAKIPAEFWEKVEEDNREALAAFLFLVWTESAIQHGMTKRRAEELGAAWRDARAQELSSTLTRNTRDWVSQVGHADGALGPARAATIARTETTIARTAGILGVNSDPESSILTDDGRRLETIGSDGGAERSRTGKAVLVWQLEVIRSVQTHCEFCPMMAGAGEEVWGKYVPSGPSAHILCVLPGNRIALPGRAVAAAKSMYVGGAIEISFSDGSKFTVTENHPVLTKFGWVKAGLLREGMEVFHTSGAERVASSVNPDNHQMPAVAEQVFAAFEKQPGVITARVPVASKDLHGDGAFIEGKVKVVHVHGLLLANRPTKAAKFVRDPSFVGGSLRLTSFVGESDFPENRRRTTAPLGSAVGAGNLPVALCGSERRPVEFSGFRQAANGNSGFRQHPTNHAAINAVFSSKAVFGLPRNVVIDNHGYGQFDSPGSARGFRANRYAAMHEEAAKGVAVDSALASEFCRRFAIDVSPNKIVRIRKFDYRGHVYTFQVEPHELFFCNGAVVKNCACGLIVAAPGTKTKIPRQSDAEIRAAMRASRVF